MVTGLTAALIVRREITVPGGGTFSVRGLSPEDVFGIYRRHSGDLALWFARMQERGEMSLDAAPALATSLLDSTPRLAAEVIAAAADKGGDDEIIDIARQLPLSAQASALEAVAELTFTQEMPPKKLLEIVVRMSRSLTSSDPTTSSPAT